MARPTKYTPETVAKVTQAIGMGSTYELAAAYAGITYKTFNEWMNSPSKSEFCEAVKLAEGKAAVVWLAKIEQAASDGQWQAAAWKLERRYPHAYGRNVTQMEVTGKDGGPVEVADARSVLAAKLAAQSATRRTRTGDSEPAQ